MTSAEKAQKAIAQSGIKTLMVQTDDGGHVFIADRYKSQNQRKISVDSKDTIVSVVERICGVHGPNWGGSRPGAGRPLGPVKRKTTSFKISEFEKEKIRELLKELREVGRLRAAFLFGAGSVLSAGTLCRGVV
ncbi:MAG: hypothetical protein AB9917_02270 [Negativicutes bacterium]